MIDSHCHLDHVPLIDNLKDIVERSKEAGLEKLLTISTTLDSFETILKIIDQDPIIYGTFGIHPHEADKEKVLKNDIINKIKLNKKIIGVGESGLDFFYNHSDKKNQIESFKDHIEASIELKVPIIVHSRNAEIDTFEILNSYKSQNPKILMHCFTGSHDLFKKLMDLNAFFSASGIITFKNSTDLQKTFSSIPIEISYFESIIDFKIFSSSIMSEYVVTNSSFIISLAHIREPKTSCFSLFSSFV